MKWNTTKRSWSQSSGPSSLQKKYQIFRCVLVSLTCLGQDASVSALTVYVSLSQKLVYYVMIFFNTNTCSPSPSLQTHLEMETQCPEAQTDRVSSEREMWSLQQIDHSATNTWKHYECVCASLQGHPCVFIHICAPQTPFGGDGSGASGLFWKVHSEQQSQKNDVFSHFVHYALFIIQSQWFPLKEK